MTDSITSVGISFARPADVGSYLGGSDQQPQAMLHIANVVLHTGDPALLEKIADTASQMAADMRRKQQRHRMHIDNPDQKKAEDLQRLCEKLLAEGPADCDEFGLVN